MKYIDMIKILSSSRNPVTLYPAEAEVINLLMQANTVNTFEFRHSGIATPSGAICTLRNKGAIIEKEVKPAIDEAGKQHKRVAHYSLVGWA
jgi:hypothetical protein